MNNINNVNNISNINNNSNNNNINNTQQLNLDQNNIQYFLERDEKPLIACIIANAFCDSQLMLEFFQTSKAQSVIQFNKDFFQFKDKLIEFQDAIKENIKQTKFIQNFSNECHKEGKRLIRLAKQLKKSEDSKKAWLEYEKAAKRYCVFVATTAFEVPLTELAKEIANKHSLFKYQEEKIINIITHPRTLTKAEEEQDDFLILCSKTNQINFEELIQEHKRNYSWMALRHFQGVPWSTNDIIQRVEDFKKTMQDPKQLLETRRKNRKDAEQRVRAFKTKCTRKEQDQIDDIQEIISLRTQRAEYFIESSFHILPVLNKLAKDLSLTFQEIMHLKTSELETLDFNQMIHLAKERRTGFFIFHPEDKILSGQELQDFLNQNQFLIQNTPDTNNLTGKVAFEGIAQGPAKIVKSQEDLYKVNHGDILVTVMTTPDFISAMEKAAGFITDEGGILCHAAIVSREMQKPCIIATKYATKTIKDGDIIELDANIGIVKKLN